MPVPASFKAAVFGGPHQRFELADRSLPALEAGQVAIKITATAINPVDWKIRDDSLFVTKFPAVVGSDAAGEIAAVGSGVNGFKEGDRVFFQGILKDGDYNAATTQQYAIIDAKLVTKTPKNVSDEEASGIALASVAALTALYDPTGFGLTPPWEAGGSEAGKGKAIVVLGGSSSVGQYGIQLAKLSGYSKIVTNSSAKHIHHLKTLGADVVLDRATQNAVDDYIAAIGSTPLDFVFDTISQEETWIESIEIIRAAKVQSPTVVDLLAHLYSLSPKVTKLLEQEPKVALRSIVGIGSLPELRYLSEPFAKHVGGEDGWLAKGLFKPNRPLVIPGGLGAIEEAFAVQKKGVSGVKVVIRPFDV